MKNMKPRSKPPLGDAITLIEHAIDMAHLYIRDIHYIPSKREVRQAENLAEALLLYNGIAMKIASTMRTRLNSAN